jgi:hypothetical protein
MSHRITTIPCGHVPSGHEHWHAPRIQARYMRSPIHCPFCRYSPLVASVSCALVSILTSLGGGWIVQHSRIPLHISWVWRGIAAGLGASVIATCLAWLLTAQMRQKHAALQKLNKELRNGLQILSYVCSQCEPEVAEQARAAVTRISSANAKASEQLGHQYRSTAWHSGNRRQVVA